MTRWPWWKLFKLERRGPLLDIYFRWHPAVVICKHWTAWPEGGIGCRPCMKAWRESRP